MKPWWIDISIFYISTCFINTNKVPCSPLGTDWLVCRPVCLLALLPAVLLPLAPAAPAVDTIIQGPSKLWSDRNCIWGPLKGTKSSFKPVHLFLHFGTFGLLVLQLILSSKLSELEHFDLVPFNGPQMQFLSNHNFEGPCRYIMMGSEPFITLYPSQGWPLLPHTQRLCLQIVSWNHN